jgi:hypothetical protein
MMIVCADCQTQTRVSNYRDYAHACTNAAQPKRRRPGAVPRDMPRSTAA